MRRSGMLLVGLSCACRIGFEDLSQTADAGTSDGGTVIDSGHFENSDGGGDGGVDAADTGPLDASPPGSFVHVEVPAFSVTTSTFTEIPGSRLVVPTAPGESWLLLVSAAITSDFSGATLMEARYVVDGVQRGIGGARLDDPPQIAPWLHFDVLTGSTATDVRFELRDGNEGFTADVRDLFGLALLLPADADVSFSDDGGEIHTVDASTGWTEIADLQIDVSSPGDYVLLFAGNGNQLPSQGSISMRVVTEQGEFWPVALPQANELRQHFHNPRSTWRSFHVARIESLAAGTHQFRVEAQAQTGVSMARHVRLVAFRVDAFGAQGQIVTDVTTSTSTTPQLVSSFTATPAAGARRLLSLQSMYGYGDPGPAYAHREVFRAGGETIADYDESLPTRLNAPYGVFRLGPAVPTTYENLLGSGAPGAAALGRESVILVLSL